ncbi:MAG: serine hydrolase domain-containing protein [Gemmatimonas sp.]|jgi:CubicO group peptidase (beta-lactamase class C family)|uniref:serine hydrolase domain-containing protein n=2 Tax=Gemmatimonas sp. TaxID=1962908 RepID=UPI00391F93B6
MLILALAALLAAQPDSAALARATDYFGQTDGQALVVMHRGRVIHEVYRAGGNAGRRQLLASGSKSLVGVATLAAVADGLVRLDQPVAAYLPDWNADPRKAAVTVRQLLSLESGVEAGNPATGCGGPSATWNDAVQAPAIADPGTQFRYGPFPFITMGAVMERVQRRSFADYLEDRLLKPLGITVEWRLTCGGDGKPQLAGGAAMTARDWATFGEFVRQGGVHQGKRLLPEPQIPELFRPASRNPAYGLSWWLAGATLLKQQGEEFVQDEGRRGGGLRDRRARTGARGTRPGAPRRGAAGTLPAWMPADLVMAAGMGSQRLYVIPSRELVVVRMGPIQRGRRFDDVAFLGTVLGGTP